MKAATASSLAAEINRLHAEAVRFAADSRRALTSALVSAWRAGQLLTQEKKRVRRMMGAGAWCHWLEQNFDGNERTAQRYMRLAAAVSDPAFLRGLSIRQAYLRLGIATEPKSRAQTVTVEMLPDYIRLASRLVRVLRHEARAREGGDRHETLRRDLADLYGQLRKLFEPENLRPPGFSNRACALPEKSTACAG